MLKIFRKSDSKVPKGDSKVPKEGGGGGGQAILEKYHKKAKKNSRASLNLTLGAASRGDSATAVSSGEGWIWQRATLRLLAGEAQDADQPCITA